MAAKQFSESDTSNDPCLPDVHGSVGQGLKSPTIPMTKPQSAEARSCPHPWRRYPGINAIPGAMAEVLRWRRGKAAHDHAAFAGEAEQSTG